MANKISAEWWPLSRYGVTLRGAVAFVVFGLAIAITTPLFFGNPDLVSAQSGTSVPASGNAPPYPTVGVRTGVFNDGQAALWDLNIIDHFHYFGPEKRARGYQPKQPINFSHVIHVQQNKIECQYCHWTVAKSSYAAIPEVETCMGCHKMMIPGKDDAAKAEIKKISEAYTANKPIEWVKVHVMPDYVKFPHQRHVKAGVACQECHGQIPEMDVVQRVSSMKMGWCIDCHRQRGTSIDCVTCHH